MAPDKQPRGQTFSERMKGQPIEVLLRGDDSGGRLALVEMDVPATFARPPLHVHASWDEGFYVLEGELTVQVGEDVMTAGPGTFAFAAREAPHTFANLSGRHARILVTLMPAGFEHYLETGRRPPPHTRTVGPTLAGSAGAPARKEP
jgi:quercetin dioxygenase-like cupin family protein